MYHSQFNAKSRGCAILINKNIPFVVSRFETDGKGRFVIVSGELFNKPITLVNLYAPNWNDSQFFIKLFSTIPAIDTHSLILGGDFNCILHQSLDRSSSKITSLSKSASTIQALCDQYGLSDPWRFLFPSTKAFFFSPVHYSFSRIDSFLIDNNLLSLVKNCSYDSIVISDHAPVSFELIIPHQPPLFKPWRLNPLLLSDDKFTQFLNSKIKLFLEINDTPEISRSTLW